MKELVFRNSQRGFRLGLRGGFERFLYVAALSAHVGDPHDALRRAARFRRRHGSGEARDYREQYRQQPGCGSTFHLRNEYVTSQRAARLTRQVLRITILREVE